MSNGTEWTVAIFAATANNLADETVWALKEIQRTEAEHPFNVIIRYASVASLERSDIGVINNAWQYRFLKGKGRDDVLPEDLLDGTLNLHRIVRERGGAKHIPDLSFRSSRESYPKNFEDLLMLATGANKANRYMIILSGHGSGLLEDFLPSAIGPRRYLSIPDLPEAISTVKERLTEGKIDILGMDSCQMSMIEICYELRDWVRYLIGSEGFGLDTGWPYHRVLETIDRASDPGNQLTTGEENDPNDSVSTSGLACNIVKRYVNYYSDYIVAGVSVDQAACDLSNVENLAIAVRSLVNVLVKKIDMIEELFSEELAALNIEKENGNTSDARKEEIEIRIREIETIKQEIKDEMQGIGRLSDDNEDRFWDAIVLAHWKAQSYKRGLYVDLWDFCYHLFRQISDGDIRKACNKVIKAIDGAGFRRNDIVSEIEHDENAQKLVLISAYSGPEYQHSHGASIYFPWNRSAHKSELLQYNQLSFSRFTRWGEFLDLYLRETQGDIRDRVKQGPTHKSQGDPVELRIPIPVPFGSDIPDNLQLGIRDNLQLGTRDNLQLGTKGDGVIIRTNNPSDSFYKYEQEAV